jgi:hypothetical protein
MIHQKKCIHTQDKSFYLHHRRSYYWFESTNNRSLSMQKSATSSLFPTTTWPFFALFQPRGQSPRARVVAWASAGREALVPPVARARMGARARRLLRADD